MLRRRQVRQRVVIAGITALAVLVGALLVQVRAFDGSLQTVTYDTFINNSPAKVKNQITIVGIDEATIKKYGRWPLPRQAYTDLLKALKALRTDGGVPTPPSVIAFDIGFYDPSPDAAQDAAFAAAIKDSPTRNDAGNLIGGQIVLAVVGSGSSTIDGGIQRFSSVQLPLPMFRDAGPALGSVGIHLSPDSRVRDTQVAVEGPEGRFYALPVAATTLAVQAADAATPDLSKIRVEPDQVVVPTKRGSYQIPIDDAGRMRIYFASPPATDLAQQQTPCAIGGEFCVVSLADVVSGKVPRQLLAGRSVYVGAHSAALIPDVYPTPNSGEGRPMYGVEIWTNVAQSIYTNRFPVPDDGALLTLVQVLAVTVLGVLAVGRFGLRGFLGAILGLVVYGYVRYLLFSGDTGSAVGSGAVHVASLGYLAPSPFWWVVVLGYLLVEEQIAVTRTQSTFGRFVTPDVARTILEREEVGALALGGEMREITVLFGDIRGFTTISEGMDAQALMGTLNRYFDGIVDVVQRYDGTVNKFNGDNIMVIWNAPMEVQDHARRAVECALQIQNWIVSERAKGTGPDVAFGFGINTGTAVAGFLGAHGRMEYTVIGDTVNVASRLTSGDIARRDQVACTGETHSRLGDDVAAVDLGAIVVKGKSEPVQCYQIDRIGEVANPNPAPPPEIPVGKATVAGYH